jgi:hypothetical protein
LHKGVKGKAAVRGRWGAGVWKKVSLSAEPVEKVQMANSDNFGTIKDQQLTGHRKPQHAKI